MRLREVFVAGAARSLARPLTRRLKRRRANEPRQADLVRAVKESGLFDAAWYARRYPDVVGEGIDPAVHYAVHGGREGRWPHPLFHGDLYLDTVPGLRAEGVNPLIHYVERGADAGLKPNPLFDPDWYAARYLGGAEARARAFFHFLKSPDADPSPLFDAAWYRSRYPDARAAGGNALSHYYETGRKQGYLRNPEEFAGLSRHVDLIRRSGLFDAEFYRGRCPEAETSGLEPLEHYVMAGGYRRYAPHPLFDPDWYAAQSAAVRADSLNPLVHFLEHGAAEGLDPGPWFDTRWYTKTHLADDEAGQNPLSHFLADKGVRTSPSPRFDAPWYLARYPKVAALGLNPLVDYVTTGLEAGRLTRRVADAAVREAADARLSCLKREPRRHGRTALFITHAPEGRIRGHVEPYLRAFAENGTDIVLIIAADQHKTAVPEGILDLCASAYLRENKGFDFAAWAHVLLEDDDLLDSQTLYLANDSLVGPLDSGDFAGLLAKIDACPEAVVGLADNFYYSHHLQSFFLALKKRCVSSYAFNHFIQSVANWPDKNAVITEYELTFSGRMRAAGLGMRSLFSAQNKHMTLVNDPRNNRTLFDWENMLGQGFPFVKRSLLGEHAAIGGEAVREAIAARGFDLARLDQTFTYPGPKLWADLRAPQAPERPLRVAYVSPMNYANGLGVAARSYARALHRAPFALNIHPMERPFHVHARVAPAWQARTFSGAPDVALVHFNGDSWHSLMSDRQRAIAASARLKVGLFVWETSHVPGGWLPTVDGLDAIWAPTEFCAAIFRQITDIPVDVVPYVVENEAGEPASASAKATLRKSFAIDPSKRVILYAFDGSSYLARKNPHALIRAFRAAGLAQAGWQLVLKTKHVFDLPDEGKRLLDLVGTTRDVVVIDQPLSQNELGALFELCAVYASSHSSEGFGLTIAEAMEMGKVVVATDYGGCRDFLDATCGFPVKAAVTALDQTYGPYLRGAEWGQVDEDDLARALTDAARVVTSGDAARIGAAARTRIRERLSIGAVAAAMEASLARLLAAQRS
ncbi:rhamnan synthesis F family protein [Methylobacterium sp. NEAU K]|uniref:rhamnan synthesis F family protein n=1 Tax=Methylobacterium sp. NEAU K TaxID=3064946 RepID=UPI0027377425|nr:rhamnan synthesis F family protein [Methylobacterium sp. NEAU K]MDP4001960.1 rhamnan synthesis F family protein [Methylobacterium sp. NEAU K]